MPIYDWKCPNGHIDRDQYARPDDARYCDCGAPMEHHWEGAPFVMEDVKPYYCVVSEKWVSTRKTRRNVMAEYDLIEAGDKKPFSERMKEHDGKPPGGAGTRDL